MKRKTDMKKLLVAYPTKSLSIVRFRTFGCGFPGVELAREKHSWAELFHCLIFRVGSAASLSYSSQEEPASLGPEVQLQNVHLMAERHAHLGAAW